MTGRGKSEESMKALIIGAAGFVGGYLAGHLRQECGWDVCVTKMSHEACEIEGAECRDLDIMDAGAVSRLLQEVRPDFIFHLAAQSSVALSWKQPGLTIDVNIRGCVNVLEAIRQVGIRPRILLIGSGEEYGAVTVEENPVSEDKTPHPGNIYAATKACQNMLGKIYTDAYRMDIMMVRAFNHIGPGQAPMFVASDFCRQVAEIEKGMREPVIHVGNLSAKRDFTDVRDIVRAYSALMKEGTAGETYNVGSGRAIAIRELLEEIMKLSDTEIRVEVDRDRFRPADVPVVEADIRKLVRDTGWERRYDVRDTLKDMLGDWRRKIEDCV